MAIPMLSTFSEVALLLAMAAVIGLLGLLMRQPLIVSFIAVGLLAGPSALDVVHSSAQIELLAELGVVILLFLLGIKLDVKLIRSLGAVSLTTGLGQVVFTSVFGYLIGLAMGLDHQTSIYVAVALTFSSTIIIVKLLSDKREIDSLHGQIALGFLIVQDLVVVLAMIVLSAIAIAIAIAIGSAACGHGEGSVFSILASDLAMVGLVVVFIRYLATPLTERLAQAPELLVVFAIAQAAIFAAIGDVVGLGKEVGGLLAGVSLVSTPYRESIAARLAPLRDFLLLFFFIALDTTLDLALLGAHMTGARGRAHRESVDRSSDHGSDGLSQKDGVPRRPDRRPDQRVLADLRRHGREPRACARGRARPRRYGQFGDDQRFDLHGHLFAPNFRLVRALVGWLRAQEPNEITVHPAESGQIILFGLGRFGTAIGLAPAQAGDEGVGCGLQSACRPTLTRSGSRSRTRGRDRSLFRYRSCHWIKPPGSFRPSHSI